MIKKDVTYGDWRIVRHDDSKMEVYKNGELCPKSAPVLREIAEEVGLEVNPENKSIIRKTGDIFTCTKDRYLYLKEKLIELLSSHTGKNKEKIAQDTERNYFMTSYNAIEYGLIDKII